jgi:hypothetical protein
MTITETRPDVIEIPIYEDDELDDDEREFVDPNALPDHPEWGL